MPANDSNAVVLANTHAALSLAEQRVFDRAERTIARGLKSFLEVGMALKEIRDKRLYRQHYRTFEEYCARRWDFSRPRAYELVAASEVVADLSAIADIRLLPENEAQARPLTRLKHPAHRQEAWQLAVQMAEAQGRAVTARDAEKAVNKINGYATAGPVDGVPVVVQASGLRMAYADPPYVGQAQRRYGCEEIDHRELIERLDEFDGWALSTTSNSLPQILALCPEGVRVAAWVKPYCVFKPNVNPAYAWEPIIFKVGRPRTRRQPTVRDWVSASITRNRGLCGAKPEAFCYWVFDVLNLLPGDEFFDLTEGTGAVTQAYRRWLAHRLSSK